MKKNSLIFIIAFFLSTGFDAIAQVCCLTNSLNISTGINPATVPATVLAPGGTDPRWFVQALLAMTASPGGAITGTGGPANVIAPAGGWAVPPSSSWISCSNQNVTSTTAGVASSMTLCRSFRLCQPETVTIGGTIYADNFIPNMTIDGGPSIFTLPAIGAGCYCGGVALATTPVALTAGAHNVCVTVQQDAVTALTNPFGLSINATVNTASGAAAIISEQAACATYACAPAIDPVPAICQGQMTMLVAIPAGGTWISLNTGVATVGLISGLLSAVAPGTATIEYTDLCGKTATFNVTILPSPAPITSSTGAFTLCQGDGLGLLNTVAGGIWSSGSPGVVSIDGFGNATAATGLGTAAVTATISYHMPGTTCFTSVVTTVYPNPVAAPFVTAATMPPCITAGDMFTLHANASGVGAPFTYSWTSTPSGFTSTLSDPVTTAPAGPENYTVVVKNIYGCITKQSIVIKAHDVPIPGKIKGLDKLCIGDGTTLGVYGNNYPGTWSIAAPGLAGVSIDPTGYVYVDPSTMPTPPATPITVVFTVTNPCGVSDFVTFTMMIMAKPTVTVSIAGCDPVCPGSAASIQVCGSPGASVSISSTAPGIPPTSFVLPLTAPACTTFVSDPLPAGVYTFYVNKISLDGCYGDRSSYTINVRKPQCSSLILDDPDPSTLTVEEPCLGDNYRFRIYGDPGTYTISGTAGAPATFTVTLPDPSTPGGYALSPWFHMQGFDPEGGAGHLFYIHSFCVTRIEGCGGCVNEATEGASLCCININPRNTPQIDGFHYTTPCTGHPITLTAFCSFLTEPWTSLQWHPGDGTTGTTIPFSPAVVGPYPGPAIQYTHTVTPTVPGTHTYSATVTSANGCAYTFTRTFNVVDPPSPIVGGASNVCVGSTTLPFASTPAGGTWSVSSGPSWLRVSIDPATGVATGLASGPATIKYAISPGCASATVLTVDPTPSAIGGELTICGVAGTQSQLTNSLGGGTWTCSPASVATISSTGLVTAISSGTATISYYTAAGCGVSAVVTVDVHAPITGSNILCGSGDVSILSIAETGGTWYSSNTDVAVVDASTGVVTAVNFGSATITYQRAPGALCDAMIDVYVVTDEGACVELLTYGTPPSAVYVYRISSFYPNTTVRFSMTTGIPGCFSIVGLSAPTPIETSPGSGIYDMGPLMPHSGYWAPYYRDILSTYGICDITDINMISFEVANPSGPSCTKISTCSASVPALKPSRQENERQREDERQIQSIGGALYVIPNPNNGIFTLEGILPGGEKDAAIAIEVLDMLGRVVLSTSTTEKAGRINTKLELKDAAPGTYLVRLKGDKINKSLHFTIVR